MANPAAALDEDIPVRYLLYAALLVLALVATATAAVVYTLRTLWS